MIDPNQQSKLSNRPIVLTEMELRRLVAEGVDDALTKLGVDAENPIEMQRDFQHLREWREAVNSVKQKGILTVIGLILTGGSVALVIGLKSMFNTP
jgi:hypothetical protein